MAYNLRVKHTRR